MSIDNNLDTAVLVENLKLTSLSIAKISIKRTSVYFNFITLYPLIECKISLFRISLND